MGEIEELYTKKAISNIKSRIAKLKKQGLDTSPLNEKSVEKWGWSKQAYEEFNKVVNRIRQRPQIEREVKAYEERVKQRKIKEQYSERREKQKKFIDETVNRNKDILTPKTKAIMKHNIEDVKPTPSNIARETRDLLSDFLKNRYFKSTASYSIEKKLDDIINRFGVRLDKANEFIDDISSMQFRYEISGINLDRGTFESDYAESWELMMEERLDEMIALMKTDKYNL